VTDLPRGSGVATSAVRELTGTYVPVDPVLLHAMAWGNELGVEPVAPAVGAVLRLLATAVSARSVVEVGTGTGASGLWILPGLRPDGLLTTIDIEPEVQRLAKQAYAAAGHAPGRTRVIGSDARDVLPRLADGAYDLVFLDAAVEDHPAFVAVAHRILRPGGLVVMNRALGIDGRVADPSAQDPQTRMLRDLVELVRDDPRWTPCLLDVGDGLLCAAKTRLAATT
jgi:predicted O-methyltransferase YrrM